MRNPSPLALLLAFACTGGTSTNKDDDTPTDGDADTDIDSDTDVDSGTTDSGGSTTACTNVLLASIPVAGDTDAYYRTPVRVQLAAAEPEASLTVTQESDGAVIAGSTTVSGTSAEWTGDPLEPLTAYRATLSWSCPDATWSFVTNAVGAPIVSDPTAEVYDLQLADGNWVEPAGVGALLATQLGDTSFLLSPTAVGGVTIDFVAALGGSGVQDLCSPTIDLPDADWADPYFELYTTELPLIFSGFELDIADASMTGAFTPDVSAMDGVAIAGQLDTRPLGAVFGLTGGYDAVCELVATFGVACEPCADGDVYCLSVRVDGLDAPSTGGTIVIRTDVDIAADPACY